MDFLRRHAGFALGYFLIAALLGVLLRAYQWFPMPFNYKFILHTHSHIALLGWVYVAITTLIYSVYLKDSGVRKPYSIIFVATQLCLLGMLCTFPFQGYGLYSIIFSTLFLFASYTFAWFFIRHCPRKFKTFHSYRLLRASLGYMVLSSLGPWALGGIMNTLGPTSDWYRLAIYFYLHFQYNGWMLLALLGLLFYVAEQGKLTIPWKWFRRFYRLLNTAIILSFLLSVLWMKPAWYIYLAAGLGAGLQCLALVMLGKLFYSRWVVFGSMFSRTNRPMLILTGLLLAVKVLLQLLSTFPVLASLAARIPDFVIGYLHWTFLGVISLWLFVLLNHYKLLRLPAGALWLYLTGFFTTEILIFYKGIAAWTGIKLFDGYFETLTLMSLFFPVALTIWILNKRPALPKDA